MVSDFATDVIVHIGEVRFYLHKVSVLVFSAIFAEVNTKHLYFLLQITTRVVEVDMCYILQHVVLQTQNVQLSGSLCHAIKSSNIINIYASRLIAVGLSLSNLLDPVSHTKYFHCQADYQHHLKIFVMA